MPLSKARMRELSQLRRDAKRQTCDKPGGLSVSVPIDSTSTIDDDKPATNPNELDPDDIDVEEEDKPKVPLFNPMIHRAGDRVMVQKGKRLIETVIPELDADGYAVYDD